jgi:transketolase
LGQTDCRRRESARGFHAVYRFDKQDAAYRESVLPKAVSARVAIEAGIADYWFKYVGLNGAIVGMTTFGESAPAELLFEEFGFTVDNVVAKAKALL